MPNTPSEISARGHLGRVLRVIDRLSDALAWVAAVGLILLAANVFADVIGRAFLNQPVRGTLEMTAHWWMPILTLLAFAFTERRQEHIKVTLLLDTLPPRMRRMVEGSFGLIAIALLVVLAWYALTQATESAGYGETTASTPPVVIWPFKFVAVAGIAMLALQSLATTIRHFANLPLAENEPDSEADVV